MSFAWSFSRMQAFETCPWRFYLTSVAKQVKEAESVEMKWGKQAHKHLEDAIKIGAPLPESLSKWQSTINSLKARGGKLDAEKQYCLDQNFKVVGWFDKSAWLRCILDIELIDGAVAFAGDWKTGKKKDGSDQLELFAGTLFKVHPDIEVAKTSFFWMQEKNPMDTAEFHRDNEHLIWQNWLPRVERMGAAYETNRWPKKPSGLCRAWCPVGKKNCEHCGKD